jgi:hypothetical protein
MARKPAATAEPSLDERTRSNLARDLRTSAARYRSADEAREKAASERDRVIRDAHSAGMTPTEISAEVELSTNRIDQIRRGGRS